MRYRRALLAYDKYDIWVLPTRAGQKPYRLTGGHGRIAEMTFRLVKMDEERLFYKAGEKVLLSGFHQKLKHSAFYRAEIGKDYVERRMEDDKKFTFLAKAKKADLIIFNREDFGEFPDLWFSSHPSDTR